MKKLEFTIEINATKEKVWDALWMDQNYRNWTSVFQEGSYYESDLQEGSKIQFFSPNKNGMYGVITKMVPFQKMYFLHKGEIKDGVEQDPIFGDEAIEHYDLKEENSKTNLSITMNMVEDYVDYFVKIFPQALEKVKEIAEK